MICKHCGICRRLNRCTKSKHACYFRELLESEAIKDIKPVRWKLGGRK